MTTAETLSQPEQARSLSTDRLITSLLLVCLDAYTAAVLTYLLGRLLAGERLWQIALIDNFAPWVLLPALPLAALLLVARRWKRALLTSVGALAFLLLYGGLFLPAIRPGTTCASVGTCRTLRVMAYNIGGSQSPERIAASLRASEADVIALIEVTAEHAAMLDQSLADLYPYRALYGEGVAGKALLSRYPIVENTGLFYLSGSHPHVMAELDVGGERLTVIAAHTDRPRFVSGRYTTQAGLDEDIATLAAMATRGGSTLLLGDFNTTDQTRHYGLLDEAGLIDSFRESGWGFGATFPVVWHGRRAPPLVRIDYIWHTTHLHTTRAWVGEDAGSDHLPILADLVWAAAAP